MRVGKAVWFLPLAVAVALLGCKQDPALPDYPRIVIDTFCVASFDANDTYLTLIDPTGAVLAEDDNGNPDQSGHTGCSRIDYQAGLFSGTYYIKVEKLDDTTNPNYGIRVLDYDPGASFPSIPDPANEDESVVQIDDATDANGVPTSPWSPPLVLGDYASRTISPELTDVDWFELVLP